MAHNPPRLLALNTYNYRRGGSDVMFLESDLLFRELGWETAIFTMNHPKNLPSKWSKYFADELEFGNSYSLGKKLQMAGKVIYSFEARKKIARLIDDWRPDIAHAHCIYHHLSPSVLTALKQNGIPAVMTAHDLKLACPAYKMLNRTGICEKCINGNLFHVAANRCVHESFAVSTLVMVESAVHKFFGLYRDNLDRVIAPSEFYLEKLVEWGWPRNKLVHIPNYVEADKYKTQYEAGDYFLFFGRLAPEKGVDMLISSCIEAGVQLKIVGTGPSEQALKVQSQGHTNVEFMGYQSGEALWDIVRGARVVVLPSQWYENAPISLLESYACGKPLLGANIGGISEMIEQGQTGYLHESANADSLTNMIAKFQGMKDSEVERLGKNARELVATKFTRQKYTDRLLNLYAQLGVKTGR